MKFFGQTPAYAWVTTTVVFISLGGPMAYVQSGYRPPVGSRWTADSVLGFSFLRGSKPDVIQPNLP
jgi:hypothetical protein